VETAIAQYKISRSENFKRYKDMLVEGEEVVVREKLQGTTSPF
jgi:hypothetical protein